MLGEYILDGFKVAVIVGAMLIGYIAIIALLNGMVSGILSFMSGGAIQWNFQTLIDLFCTFRFPNWNTVARCSSIWFSNGYKITI